jgi:HD-like signal output (HDOD) protein
MRKPDAGLADVAQVLEQDPVLCAKVLRMANSSFFGGRRSSASIGDAVGVIGLKPLETLLVASGAQAAFEDVASVNLAQFWTMASHSAAVARQLAARTKMDREAAYSAALLQGVGHLILCKFYEEKARLGLPRHGQLWGSAMAKLDSTVFGLAHHELAAVWVDKLGLPENAVRAVAQAFAAEPAEPLAALVCVACDAAAQLAQCGTPAAWQAALLANPKAAQRAGLLAYANSAGLEDDLAELKAMQTA